MAFSHLLIFLGITAIAAVQAQYTATCTEDQLLVCNGQRYCPSQYICYSDIELCPVQDGVEYEACVPHDGSTYACYNPYIYKCSGGRLTQLGPESSPFTLVANGGPSGGWDGEAINACGRTFTVGGSTCSYCPTVVTDNNGICPPGDQTVLIGGSSLDVEVPGGQQYFLDPSTGYPGFTQAHSASYPPGSIFGATAYEGGEWVYPGTLGWLGCACTSMFECPNGVQLVAWYEDKTYPSTCYPVVAVVQDYPAGEVPTWQYT